MISTLNTFHLLLGFGYTNGNDSAGVPKYWVVNLRHRQFEIFRDPDRTTYRQRQTVTAGTIAPIAFPNVTIVPEDILR